MRANWRALPDWPYERTPKPRGSSFKTSWPRSLQFLEDEIGRHNGRDIEIGVVASDDQFTLAGQPRSDFKVRYRGVQVSFDTGNKRLVFKTDVFTLVHDNLHAIARGLEALRLVDRYGITTGGEQYQGFAQIGPGPDAPSPERGKRLAEAAGGLKAAIKAHHPDVGGNARDLADVMAYKDALGA